MFNVLLIHDNLDEKRGEYFSASHQNMIDKLSILDSPNLQSLNTNLCLANPIENYISAFNGQPFIFVAYAHGSEDTLEVGGEQYIHERNAYFFSETLFYACSCLSAKMLGLTLMNEGCRVFAGYNARISTLNPECEPIFYECENAFLTHFLTTNSTIQDSLRFMYLKYQEMAYHLQSEFNTFTASELLGENLKAFKLFCSDADRELTKLHFVLNN